MTIRRYRILLADDDPELQRAVGRLAAQRGYELHSVLVGAEVCQAAIALMPDLIVLDVIFPDADGRDVLSRLKADERTKSIPVLVWSGQQDRDSQSRIALSLGAEDYVEKANAQLLLHKIERLTLRLRGSAA